MTLPDFIAKYWCSQEGELLAGGLSVSSLAAHYGTPVFIYDKSIVDRKLQNLRAALPDRFHISYSMKANPNPAFVSAFVEKGCGVEIASAGEFHLARIGGCTPENMLFAGPGKTEADLELAIAEGIGEIHAESGLELDRISAISRRLGVRTRVAVRVNPSDSVQGGAMRMGGKPAPFGIDEENLEAFLSRAVSDSDVDLCGVHLFIGTQILDSDLLLAQYQHGLGVARGIASRIGCPLHTLDFGGGLGIPYFPGECELDLTRLREGLHGMLKGIETEPCFSKTRFVIEPGRFLVGEAGVYVATINDIKTSRGKKYLILDGGMNHHLAASGNLGQVIKRNFPIATLNKLDEPAAETCELVGPLCTPLDTLARAVQLPVPEVGDLVGIFQSGAYTRAASPLGFLSHPTPPEIWVARGDAHLIRRRGTFQDALHDVPLLDCNTELRGSTFLTPASV